MASQAIFFCQTLVPRRPTNKAQSKQNEIAQRSHRITQQARFQDYWGRLLCLGPDYGYHPNAQKTALVTKEQHLSKAERLFHDTGLEITAAGHRYLAIWEEQLGQTCSAKIITLSKL